LKAILNNSTSFDGLLHIKGSRYNVLVEWETGETTYEPLDMIASDDPITCAQYAIDNKLLDTDGSGSSE
jgi:hypothetical protein